MAIIQDIKVPSFYIKNPIKSIGPKSIVRTYRPRPKIQVVERRHAKNLGDIILGHPITGTKQLKHTLEDAGLDELVYVPLLNRIVGAGVMANERFIQPLIKGESLKAGVNVVESLGQDLDILANPVKSLFSGAGGGSMDDFLDSLGLQEHRYRKQYQWDTGNFVSDLALELISDPTFVISLLKTPVRKGVEKGILTPLKEQAPNILGDAARLIPDGAWNMGYDEFVDDLLAEDGILLKRIKDTLIRNADQYKTLQKASLTPDLYLNTTEKELMLRELLSEAKEIELKKALQNARQSKLYKQAVTIGKVIKAADTFDATMLRGSLAVSTAGLSELVIRAAGPAYNIVHNTLVNSLKSVDVAKLLDPTKQVYKEIDHNLDDVLSKLHADDYALVRQMLSSYEFNPDVLKETYHKAFNSTPKHLQGDMDVVKRNFLNEIAKKGGRLAHYVDRLQELGANATDAILDAAGVDIKALHTYLQDIMLRGHVELELNNKKQLMKLKTAADNIRIREANPELIMKELLSMEHTVSELGEQLIRQNVGMSKDVLQETIATLSAEQNAVLKVYQNLLNETQYANKIIRGYKYHGQKLSAKEVKYYEDLVKNNKILLDSYKERLATNSTSLRAYNTALNKKYTLKELPEFLRLLEQDAPELYERLYTELKAIGINSTNYLQVNDLMQLVKQGDEAAFKKLVAIIRKAKEGFDYTKQTTKDVIKSIKKATNFRKTDSVDVLKQASVKHRKDTEKFLVDAEELTKDFNKNVEGYNKFIKDTLDYFNIANEADLQTLVNDWSLVESLYRVELSFGDEDDRLVDALLRFFQTKPEADLSKVMQFNDLVEELRNKITRLDNILSDQTSSTLYKQHAGVINTVKQQARYLKDAINEQLSESVAGNYLYYFIKLANTQEPIYKAHISAYARLAEITNYVYDVQTAKNADWWADMLNPHSNLRTRYKEIINKLVASKDEVKTAVAKNMTDVLRTIDNNHLLISAATDAMDIGYKFKLPQDLRNSLANTFYDTIHANRSTLLTEVLGNRLYEDYAKDFMERILAISKARGVYTIDENYEEIYTEALQFFRSFFQKQSAVFADDATRSYIGLSFVFNPAINNQHLGYNAVLDYMNNLGSYYHTIAEDMLTDTTLSLDETADLLDFIHKTTVKELGLSKMDMQQKLDAVKRLDKAAANEVLTKAGSIDNALIEGANDSLAASILQAYEYTKNINVGMFDSLGYLLKTDLEDHVHTVLAGGNIADFISYDGYVGFRKEFDPFFADAHKIAPKNFLSWSALGKEPRVIAEEDEVYRRFYDKFKYQYEFLENNTDMYDKYTVEYWREELLQQSLEGKLPVTPGFVDRAGNIIRTEATYFKEASDLEILAWASVAQHHTPDANKLPTRSIPERVAYYTKRQSLYAELENIADDVFEDPEAYEPIIQQFETKDIPSISDYIVRDLNRPAKDPISLGTHKQQISNWINGDVEAWKNTQALNPYAMKLNKTDLMKAKNTRSNALIYNLTEFNAKQLGAYIADNTRGYMIINMNRADDLQAIFKNKSAQDLLDAGLEIKFVDENTAVVINKRALNYDKVKYVWKVPTYEAGVQTAVTDLFKKNKKYYFVNDMNVPEELYTGEMLNKEFLDTLEDTKLFKEILGDDEVRKTYLKSSIYDNTDFITEQNTRMNFMIVGDGDAFNRVAAMVEPEFAERGVNVARQSDDLVKSVFNSNVSAIKRANNKHKYLSLFLNKDYSVGHGIVYDMLKNKSNEELKQLFTRNNWDICVVKESLNKQPKVYKIHVTNQKELEAAVKAGAIMVPHDVYRNMVLTINKNVADPKWLKFYKRTIASTFKIMYLSSLGMLVRNGVDSAFFKNLSATDGFSSIFENFKYEARAVDLLRKHDAVQKQIRKLAESQGMFGASRQATREVLSKLTAEERTAYIMTDIFVTSHASGGLSKTMQDILLEYNTAGKTFDGFAFEKVWLDMLNKAPIINQIQDVNSWIEQVSRYGLYLNLLEHGGDATEALRKVVNTHFDYALKTGGTEWLEQLFWFATFPINNYLYFVNEGLNRNLDMIKLQLDATEQSWNNDEYTYEDALKSDYLMRNILAGNIRINVGDKNFVIKTGSSLFDFLNIIINPAKQPIDRLNPFLSVLFGIEDTSQLNPFYGLYNRGKQVAQGKSYIPSLYAELYGKREYPRPAYPTAARTWRTYTRKIRRPYDNSARLRYKFMTYRYYYGKGTHKWRQWISSANATDHTWGDYSNNRYQQSMRVYFNGSKYLRHKI